MYSSRRHIDVEIEWDNIKMFDKTLNRETILTTQNNGKYYDKKDINGRTEQ